MLQQADADAYIVAPSMAGTMPDYLLTLTVGAGGSADIYCRPMTDNETDAINPGPDNFVWTSSTNIGQSSVFISRDSPEYIRTTNLMGNPLVICSVVASGPQEVAYTLHMNEDMMRRDSAAPERVALNWIFYSCCREEGTCSKWHEMNERFHARPFTNFCYMPGSLCNAAGQLLRLDMTGYGLTCDFPGIALANLRQMQQLDLTDNHFKGDIGEIAQSLQSNALVELSIAGNQITGDFSKQDALCGFAGRSLVVLDLRGNSIHGSVPACLIKAGTTITELRLGGNLLSGSLPNRFSAESPLQLLDVSHNRLIGTLPASLGNAPFVSLDLSHNAFNSKLHSSWRFDSLETFDLSDNLLEGELGDSITTAASLQVLRASHNRFYEMSAAFLDRSAAQLPSGLQLLDISDNELEGSFPLALAAHPVLETLLARNNYFSGPLPSGSKSHPPFPKVRVLDLASNNLAGPIPQGLKFAGMFSLLPKQPEQGKRGSYIQHVINLADNQLSGAVPDYFQKENVQYQLTHGIRLAANNFDCPLSDSLLFIPNITCGVWHPPKESPAPFYRQLYRKVQHSGLSNGQKVSVAVAIAVVSCLLIYILVMLCCWCSRVWHRRHYRRPDAKPNVEESIQLTSANLAPSMSRMDSVTSQTSNNTATGKEL